MKLEASGTFTANSKVQYLHTLLRGKVFRKLEILCAQIGSTDMTHLNQVLFGLGMYFSSVKNLSKQKRVMHHGMRKPRKVEVGCYN